MTSHTPIKSIEAAKEILAIKIQKNRAEIESIESQLGNVSVEETEESIAKFKTFVGNITPENASAVTDRVQTIVSLDNKQRFLKDMEKTANLELVAPHGNFLLLPHGERLSSPAGFHPDEQIFVKPSAGAMVPELPQSSNLSYYDFTK